MTLTRKQAEEIKEIMYMGYLWAYSLIDAGVENGPDDMKIVRRATRMFNKKFKKMISETTSLPEQAG